MILVSFVRFQMVTFAKNPYSWADDQDINSAILKVNMTYKDKPLPASSVKNGLGVTLPNNMVLSSESFRNASLTSKNNFTAVISLERGSPASVLQLYCHVGRVTAQDLERFNDLSKLSWRKPVIYSGHVNVTLFRGNSSVALQALQDGMLHLFEPVWLLNFRFRT